MNKKELDLEITKRLTILYNNHHTWLSSVAWNLTKNQNDCDDLVGELYLYLGEKRNEDLFYKDSFNLKYCQMFISSRFYNKKNRDKKMVVTDVLTEDMDNEYDYDEDNRLEEAWGALKQELNELKTTNMWSSAQLYEMYQFQNLTLEQLSEKIGISKSTTFINIKKIKEHLKNKLNNPFDGE
jgi:DNA-directed RNA polymerase specialized sigma24 family protein